MERRVGAVLNQAANLVADLGYGGVWHARTTLGHASASRFRPGREGYPTIVGIAGVLEPWDFLLPLLDGLNDAGFPIHVVEELGRNFGGVAELAEYVSADLEAAGVGDAIILGHSKGGLVAKAVLLLGNAASEDTAAAPAGRDAAAALTDRSPGEGVPEAGRTPGGAPPSARPPRILGVIAIASPFRGTRLANFIRRGRELSRFRPSSRDTVRLRVHDAFDDRIVSVMPETDMLVSDPGRLEQGRNVVVPVHGHSRLLGDPRTLAVCLRAARTLALEAGVELPALEAQAPPKHPRRAGYSLAAHALSRLPRAAQPGGLAAWGRDYGAALVGQLTSLRPSGIDLASWRTGRPGGATIVLVPGVYERWGFLRALGERLHAAGHAVHVVPELGWNRAELATSADILARVLAGRNLRDVIVIAHSKGGLIAKLAMMRPETGARIRHLIAIATPFSGSPYARIFLDRSIRAFSPSNPELRGLAREISVNSRITTITPSFDPHIPGDRALAGAAQNLELPLEGHFSVLDEPLLLETVASLVAELEEFGPAAGEVVLAEGTAAGSDRQVD